MDATVSRQFIKSRIFLVSGLPILIAVAYLFNDALTEKIRLNELHVLQSVIRFDEPAGRLIHEMQKERGLSTLFLSSSNDERKSFYQRLIKQRLLTDNKLRAFENYLASEQGQAMQNILEASALPVISELGYLAKIRNDIDQANVTRKRVLDYYSGQNTQIMELIQFSANMVDDSKTAIDRNALVAFLREKDLAGLERAILGSVFIDGEFQNEAAEKYFQSLVKQQANYQDLGLSMLTDKDYLFFYLKNKSEHATLREATRLRNIVLNKKADELFEQLQEKLQIAELYISQQDNIQPSRDAHEKNIQEWKAQVDGLLLKLEKEFGKTKREIEQLGIIRNIAAQYSKILEHGFSENKIDPLFSVSNKRLIDVAFQKLRILVRQQVTPAYWFDIMTKKIDLMAEQESYLIDLLIKKNDLNISNIRESFLIKITFAVLLTLVFIILLFFILKDIDKHFQKKVNFFTQFTQT